MIPNYAGDQMKNNEIGGHVACMGDRRGAYEVLKSEEERPLGRTMHNVTTNLTEIGWECVDLVYLVRIGTGGGLV